MKNETGKKAAIAIASFCAVAAIGTYAGVICYAIRDKWSAPRISPLISAGAALITIIGLAFAWWQNAQNRKSADLDRRLNVEFQRRRGALETLTELSNVARDLDSIQTRGRIQVTEERREISPRKAVELGLPFPSDIVQMLNRAELIATQLTDWSVGEQALNAVNRLRAVKTWAHKMTDETRPPNAKDSARQSWLEASRWFQEILSEGSGELSTTYGTVVASIQGHGVIADPKPAPWDEASPAPTEEHEGSTPSSR